ncbi:MAG: peptide chain release factor N(5)-glutamine methyltransferase [Mariprofundales bacterium]
MNNGQQKHKASDALHAATLLLKNAACPSPRLDAELLLMYVWQVERSNLYIHLYDYLECEIYKQFMALVAKRCQRQPVAYLIGERYFWSLETALAVSPDVLIPRPESEHLIEAILEFLPNHHKDYNVCDIGTGSGCLAIALACEYPQAQIVVTDISAEALKIARRNAVRNNISTRMQSYCGDLFAALPNEETTNCFDLIISNPPYIAVGEEVSAETIFEPQQALYASEQGLQILRRLLSESPRWLKPKGWLVLETGLCGLPDTPACFILCKNIIDLAGNLRGAVYQLQG